MELFGLLGKFFVRETFLFREYFEFCFNVPGIDREMRLNEGKN